MSLQERFNVDCHLGIQKAYSPPPVGSPIAIGELAAQAMSAATQSPGGTGYARLAAIGIAGITAAGYGAYRLWAQTPKAGDFPQAQPDPKFVVEIDLELLKQQRTLAELSGNKSLAQLLNVRIQQLSTDDPTGTTAQPHGQRALTGGLNMVANAGEGDSAVPTDAITWLEEQIARRGLKDSDLNTQWRAWNALYRLNPDAAQKVTPDDMGPPQAVIEGTLGVLRFISKQRATASNGVRERLLDYYDEPWFHEGYVDLRQTHPSHSLAEFSPYFLGYADVARYSYQDYRGRLRILITKMGLTDPQAVLRAFMKETLRDNPNQELLILQLPSGKLIIWDGHHHAAALIEEVRERDDLNPEIWLSHVPAQVFVVDPHFPIPEHLILRFFAPGHELSVFELLPPPVIK